MLVLIANSSLWYISCDERKRGLLICGSPISNGRFVSLDEIPLHSVLYCGKKMSNLPWFCHLSYVMIEYELLLYLFIENIHLVGSFVGLVLES